MQTVIISVGEEGKQVADFLLEWLPQVLPNADLLWLKHDISPITLSWQRSLLSNVELADAIIFCVTPESVLLPETLLQIGMVAGRNIRGTIYPLFIGIDRPNLPQVFGDVFQCVFADKDSVLSLVKNLNKRAGPKAMPEALLLGVFSARWSLLESTFGRLSSQWRRTSNTRPPEERPIPRITLSSEARGLLVEAAADPHGTVISVATFGGRHLQTNGKALVEPGNPRSEARGIAALRELVNAGLLEPTGSKGETYQVTSDGYRVADEIRLAQPGNAR